MAPTMHIGRMNLLDSLGLQSCGLWPCFVHSPEVAATVTVGTLRQAAWHCCLVSINVKTTDKAIGYELRWTHSNWASSFKLVLKMHKIKLSGLS